MLRWPFHIYTLLARARPGPVVPDPRWRTRLNLLWLYTDGPGHSEWHHQYCNAFWVPLVFQMDSSMTCLKMLAFPLKEKHVCSLQVGQLSSLCDSPRGGVYMMYM